MEKRGGQFAPNLGGQFKPNLGGQFKLKLGGQYHRSLQLVSKLYGRNLSSFVFTCLVFALVKKTMIIF